LWQDTVKKSPHKWRPYCFLGQIHMGERGGLETALRYFHKSLEAGSYSTVLLTNMAVLYSRLGHSKESAYYQERAFAYAGTEAHYPQDILNYNEAVSLRQQKKIPEAIDALKKAITVDPQNYFFQLQLGKLHFEAGQEEAAIVSFRKAIELAPLSREGYDALALLYKKRGENQKAVDVMVEYLKFKEKHKSLFGG
jgi:tetratricopeptide (TPR) repeat protein